LRKNEALQTSPHEIYQNMEMVNNPSTSTMGFGKSKEQPNINIFGTHE
jgi:hypothetical protein